MNKHKKAFAHRLFIMKLMLIRIKKSVENPNIINFKDKW